MAAGVYLSEAQNPIPSPPPYTLTHYIRVDSILIHTGKGGVEEGRGATGHKAGSKIPTRLSVILVYKL